MSKIYPFLDIVAIATSSQPPIHCLPQFCSDCTCCLVCKQRRDRVVLNTSKASSSNLIYFSSKTILTDVFVQVIVSSIRTNRARCALYKKMLDLLDKESVSGESSGRASLKKSYRECLKK